MQTVNTINFKLKEQKYSHLDYLQPNGVLCFIFALESLHENNDLFVPQSNVFHIKANGSRLWLSESHSIRSVTSLVELSVRKVSKATKSPHGQFVRAPRIKNAVYLSMQQLHVETNYIADRFALLSDVVN